MGVFTIIATYIAAAIGTLVIGLAFKWFDRKVTAMVQWRKGPPWYQPVADVLKLLYKETLLPSTARRTGFLFAPAVGLAATALAAAILWSALLRPESGFVGDIIVIVYLLMLPPIMTIFGAIASGSPHAAVGASREMKLILSYELPLILALLVGVIHSGWSLQPWRSAAGVTPLYSISGVIAMLVAIVAMQAKLGQVPFDAAEAECEIMSGVYVEYSGTPLAIIYLGRAMLLAVMPLLLITVLWGGLVATPLGIAAFIGKYVLLVVLVTLIRNTNPRLRIDQAMKFFWMGVAPLGIAAVVLAVLGANWAIKWL